MARRVARSGLEANLIRDARIAFDQVRQPGLEYRAYRVVEQLARVGLARLPPVIPFLAPDEIARTRKRRRPFAIDQHRVPSDMVYVQMGTEHAVNRVAREAGFLQV